MEGPGDNNGLSSSAVLRLRGLPFSVNAEDIVSWFNDGAITPITTEKYASDLLKVDWALALMQVHI